MYVMSIIRQRPENADKNRIIWKQFQMCQGPFENALFLVWIRWNWQLLKTELKNCHFHNHFQLVDHKQKYIKKSAFSHENGSVWTGEDKIKMLVWSKVFCFFSVGTKRILLKFIIVFIIYFIFMSCPQLASAKYINTWIKFIIIIVVGA